MIFGNHAVFFFWVSRPELMMFDFWEDAAKIHPQDLRYQINLLISFPNNINFMVRRYFGARGFRIAGMPEVISPLLFAV